ncbi:MAG: hypothetical protein CVV32_04765 [Methanomicrobiales archaeon HGW-Methanomicrobiales-3]|jgi:predicted ATP-dependent endonuclease of OLD family|nr:MAG: hypothetical protein CVV32_04765 [Methanomicrobiales archaeon HGW-Methanomicrobiales-3]
MPKLKEINIFHFKGIQKMEYHPKQINLLIGKNNTGKTTLLSAINCLFSRDISPDSFESPEYEININSKIARISSGDHDITIYRDIVDIDSKVKNEIIQEVNKKIKKIFSKELDDNKTDDLCNSIFNNFRFLTLIKNHKHVEVFPYSKNYKKNRIQNLESLKKYFPDVDRRGLIHLLFEFSSIEFNLSSSTQKNPKKIKVVSIYHENKLDFSFHENSDNILKVEGIIKENNIIKNFERLTEDGVLLNEGEKKIKYLPYAYYGDGFKSLLTIITKLIEAKNGILLIEEIENHLHPGYITILGDILFKLSNEYKVQVFMTTHSFDLIKEVLLCGKNNKMGEKFLISKFVLDDGKISRYDYSLEQALKISDNFALDLRGV